MGDKQCPILTASESLYGIYRVLRSQMTDDPEEHPEAVAYGCIEGNCALWVWDNTSNTVGHCGLIHK